MGRSRSFDTDPKTDTSLASVAVEVEGFSPAGAMPKMDDVGARERPGVRITSNSVRVIALCGIGLALAVAVALITTIDPTIATPEQSVAEPPRRPAQPEVASVVPTTSAVSFIDQLPNAPDDWLDGQVLAWIDENDRLRARQLVDGAEIDVGVLAEHNLPPLPPRILLIGATNATWLIDPFEPERSGKLSNSVRMVRLGEDLDSYGFISVGAEQTQFFVGSLWGPSMNGTAEVPNSTATFPVQHTGIVVSSQAADSGIVVGGGIDPLPSRLGRIVAASPTRVAGIHCDDLGRCVGRVADWDGANEVQVDANRLNAPIIKISPDGRFIVAAGRERWTVFDIELGGFWTRGMPITANETLTWSADSKRIMWVSNDALLAVAAEPNLPIARVRQFGELGARLPESDVLVYDVR